MTQKILGDGFIWTTFVAYITAIIVFFSSLFCVPLEECGVKHDFNIYPNSNHGLESDPENAQIADELFAEYVLTYLGAEK